MPTFSALKTFLRHTIHSLALAERQILGSRKGRSFILPTPDATFAWCHRCGAPRNCIHTSQDNDKNFTCKKCIGVCLARDRTIRLGTYEGQWRNAILAVKHGGDRTLARDLGKLLAHQWQQTISSASFVGDDAIIIPVPMPFTRRVERGIDHASEIASGVSKTLGYPMIRCLEHDAGPVQAQMTRADRQARSQRIRWKGIQKRKFRPFTTLDLPSIKTVFVVDDVLTTGSTAAQVCAAIRNRLGPVKIVMLVVATT